MPTTHREVATIELPLRRDGPAVRIQVAALVETYDDPMLLPQILAGVVSRDYQDGSCPTVSYVDSDTVDLLEIAVGKAAHHQPLFR